MQFTHKTYTPGDAIVALATPPGEGGVAIVRISGNNALEVGMKMLRASKDSFESHKAKLMNVYDQNETVIDKSLILPLLGKKSFTGEDTIEIHCHGGVLIPKKVIERAITCGARAAGPGEFSYRAFINGKLSLSQAEAIQSLIAAKSDAGMRSALQHLEGRLHTEVEALQKTLFDVAAILEAWVDFPEEGLEFATFEEVIATLQTTLDAMKKLLQTYDDGKRLSTSYSLCLLGEPNVGKSSILNALSGKERAIVTHIPGTTRDLLEEELQFGGYSFKLIDTAGIRETEEIVEKEGVRRSQKAAKEADIVLLVFDRSKGIGHASALLDVVPKDKTVIVWNKADIPDRQDIQLPFPQTVHVSARAGIGIDTLKEAIHSLVGAHSFNKEEVLLTSERHFSALQSASMNIEKVIEGLKSDLSAEFVSSDMRECLKDLGTIIGSDVTEDLLSSIFSKFCVGK